MSDNDILDARTLAGLFGCSYSQIIKQTKSGQLPSFRVGVLVRYRKADIEQFMNEQVKQAKQQKSTPRETPQGAIV